MGFSEGATAQQPLVSPSWFATTPAFESDSRPFRLPYRWLQVHDDVVGPPRTIGSIAFRRDETVAGQAHPGFAIRCRVWMSHAAVTAETVDAAFLANHGPDRILVRSDAEPVRFPPAGEDPPVPGFDYRIEFDTPFSYDGRGPLCWEIEVINTIGSVEVDEVLGENPEPFPAPRELSTGCTATGQFRPFRLETAPVLSYGWSGFGLPLSFLARNTPRGLPAVMVLGVDYAPRTLPDTPGGRSGPCVLALEPLCTVPFDVDQALRVTVPLHPAFHGITLITQLVGADSAANDLGVVTSTAHCRPLTAPHGRLGVGRVSSSDRAAAVGRAFPAWGLVTQFD